VKFGLPCGLQPGHPQLLTSPRGRQASAARSPTDRGHPALPRTRGQGAAEGLRCGAAGATLDGRASGPPRSFSCSRWTHRRSRAPRCARRWGSWAS